MCKIALCSVSCVKFIPKTHLLFSAGKDRMVKQWDADNYEHVITLKVIHIDLYRHLCIQTDMDTYRHTCRQNACTHAHTHARTPSHTAPDLPLKPPVAGTPPYFPPPPPPPPTPPPPYIHMYRYTCTHTHTHNSYSGTENLVKYS